MNKQTGLANNSNIPPIDPHFLYNTLDAINWMALDRQEYTISRMLTSLAATLRYTLHDNKEQICVEEEVEYLRKFLYLQQQRFAYKFSCLVKAQETAGKIQIPRLLIQPILEAVLETGDAKMEGHVSINFRMAEFGKKEILRIMIEMTGMPLIEETVIETIRRKLLNCYGTQAILLIDGGCKIEMQLPVNK